MACLVQTLMILSRPSERGTADPHRRTPGGGVRKPPRDGCQGSFFWLEAGGSEPGISDATRRDRGGVGGEPFGERLGVSRNSAQCRVGLRQGRGCVRVGEAWAGIGRSVELRPSSGVTVWWSPEMRCPR